MTASHGLDLIATSEIERLMTLVNTRLGEAVEKSAETFADFEKGLAKALNDVGCRVMQAEFERYDMKAKGVLVDEKRYRFKGEAEKSYLTPFGEVRVNRTIYVERGGHGGASVVPLELRVGVIDGYWSPRAAELGCRYLEESTPKKGAELIAMNKGMSPSPSQLDRLPKRVSRVWEGKRIELEEAVREADELPPEAEVASIGVCLDGIMLPVKSAPRSEEPGGPRGHKEAACATLSLYNTQRERLHVIRIGRMPESKKVTLKEQMEAEMKALKARYPRAAWLALGDGAKENWRIFNQLGLEVGVKLTRVLDFWHMAGHMGDAMSLAHGSDKDSAKTECAKWQVILKENCHGPGKLIRRLSELSGQVKGKEKKKEFEKELTYFENHRDKMRYAKLLRHNQPIGSGEVEAACKTLVTQRMKQSGMSWEYEGGQAILTLRSLHQSNRMEEAWNVLRPEFRKPVDVDPNERRQRPRYLKAAQHELMS